MNDWHNKQAVGANPANGANLEKNQDKEREEFLLLQELLTAARFKDDPEQYREIVIERKGKVLFSFHVRPLEEEELQECRKHATQYGVNPQNRSLSMETGVDLVKLRSYKIYLATIEEDRKKIWDNGKLQREIGVLQGVDAIDRLLLAGEKDRVCNIIDENSGFQISLEEYAKN